MNDAYFLKHLSKDPKLNVPDIDSENIIIYLPKKGSGLYQDSDYKGRDKEFYSFTALIDMKPEPGYVAQSKSHFNQSLVGI